ncbi:MAG TPA: hypothetical protein VF898_03945 [Chloroflexota bacterium]
MRRPLHVPLSALFCIACLIPSCTRADGLHRQTVAADVSFKTTTGPYTVRFRASTGAIVVTRTGTRGELAIREIPGSKSLDLLYSVRRVRHSGRTYMLDGASSWASFTLTLELASTPGLIHLKLSLTPRKSVPNVKKFAADVQLQGAPASSLKEYASAPPVAGTSVMMSCKPLKTTAMYLANFTALGTYFDRTQTGVAQSTFTYPNAGTKGSLVGSTGSGSFGYPLSASDLGSLPHGKSTLVLDSYLYLMPSIPSNETAVADTYLRLLGSVYDAMPKPSIPNEDWQPPAAQEATDLLDPANLVTVNGQKYLRSYVSDTRSAPELITQVGVLAGVKAYESKFHTSLALDSMLEASLPSFYDPQFHSIVNGLGHDPGATGESWYFVTNMISLLQLAQLGSANARTLLLDSTGAVISLAHVNNYEFPQNFRYSDWNGQGSALESDVAGGYAWLMLGLYDLTKDDRYLREAEASIVHMSGKGFSLAYETHMSAYGAAAAERLYTMTNNAEYRGDALLALANLFHATRLWDCTYGMCRKGSGYHTYFGLNPLPWSDYIAMLEQYEAWLGLRDYLNYAGKEPSYVRDLVEAFVSESPKTMQYALPTRLPPGAATSAAGEYPFVPHNNLTWDIPLEDLRTGEQISGSIGQEIYGGGGPFMFAAYGP